MEADTFWTNGQCRGSRYDGGGAASSSCPSHQLPSRANHWHWKYDSLTTNLSHILMSTHLEWGFIVWQKDVHMECLLILSTLTRNNKWSASNSTGYSYATVITQSRDILQCQVWGSLSFSHLPQPPPYFSFQVKLKCWLLAEGHVVKMPFKLPTFSHLPHPRPRVSQVIYSTSSPSTAGIWNFSILYRFLNSAIPWFLSWIIHLILHSRKSSLPFFPYYLCLSPSLQRSPSTNSRDV